MTICKETVGKRHTCKTALKHVHNDVTLHLALCDSFNLRLIYWPLNMRYHDLFRVAVQYEGHFRSNVNVIMMSHSMLFTSKAVYHQKRQP